MSEATFTPGPWRFDALAGGGWAVVIEADAHGAKVIADLDDAIGDRGANADFIAHAPTDIAALLADYDAANHERDDLSRLLDECDRDRAVHAVRMFRREKALREALAGLVAAWDLDGRDESWKVFAHALNAARDALVEQPDR